MGSNPTPSANPEDRNGEMAESAEGARLLSECRVKSSTEGSNPSLSAIRIDRRVTPDAPWVTLFPFDTPIERKIETVRK